MAPLRGSDEGCTCKPKASPWAELGQPFGPKPVCADCNIKTLLNNRRCIAKQKVIQIQYIRFG